MTEESVFAALLGCPEEQAGKSRTPQFARVIDLGTGEAVWSSQAPCFFQGVGYDPSGRHLVVSQGSGGTSDDWAIVGYDSATMAEAGRLPVGSQDVSVAAFSRDGRLAAIRRRPWYRLAGGNATLQVLRVAPILRGESPGPLFQPTGSTQQFYCLKFSPDGSRLMSAGDNVLRLWEATNGAGLTAIRRNEGRLGANECCFSADGQQIWAGLDEHGRLWRWDATPLRNEAGAP
jgi:WD40 repeat protein